MKNIVIPISIAVCTLCACNNSDNTSTSEKVVTKDSINNTTVAPPAAGDTDHVNSNVSVKGIVDAYLQVKNAFFTDNSAAAATAASTLEKAFKDLDKGTLASNRKKTFEDIAEDAIEHAEHISKNSGKIAHQRTHFKMLSEDMYDLVKAFGVEQTLYKDFCPMYNEGKGAYWLSETKEIRNPYLGKKMPDCGTVKEEIK